MSPLVSLYPRCHQKRDRRLTFYVVHILLSLGTRHRASPPCSRIALPLNSSPLSLWSSPARIDRVTVFPELHLPRCTPSRQGATVRWNLLVPEPRHR